MSNRVDIHIPGQDPQARRQLERELEPGERLLWCSPANPDRLAKRAAGSSLVGIPFLAFSIFWTVSATSAGAPAFFTLWGLMFCGIGVWILVSPIVARQKGQSTFYGVSDRRAISVEDGVSRTVRSWGRREMGRLSRVEHADGSGDVIFAQEMRRGNRGHSYREDIGFFGIRDARAVEALLRDILA